MFRHADVCRFSAFNPGGMDRPDLVGHELLQAPQIAVMDAECFEVADGVVKIFGAGTYMAARACQYLCHPFERLPERRAPTRTPTQKPSARSDPCAVRTGTHRTELTLS